MQIIDIDLFGNLDDEHGRKWGHLINDLDKHGDIDKNDFLGDIFDRF